MVSPRNSTGLKAGPHESRQAELIERVACGDQQALASLYDATSRLVFGLLVRVVGDASTAEEVMLDVYAQVWRQAGRYSPERGSPLAWLTTIARSRALDCLRSGRERQKRTEQLDPAAHAAPSGADVEGEVAARERAARVRAALAELPAEQREVIELAYYGGMSHSEIAAATRTPLGTVKTRTRLGMMRLRESLKGLDEGND